MLTSSQSPVFALDIGTRSVVGLLLKKQDSDYEVIDIEIEEHSERSMVDGQIHNVLAVSKVITSVKEKLEQQHGPLKKVCVAAAGRSLKTKQAKVDLDISTKPIFEHDDILHLELSAVQQAQYLLAQEDDNENSFHYYCVGYSVISYKLDGEEIGSLVDQQGAIASVEVIATFLPKVVVESLLAALQRSNLQLEALTLEPIAAINVLIPPSMRRLNVALVDIGAGTSDIAITDHGTVVAYGMVPKAGDEITEAISDHFLLDFPEAELVKRQLSSRDEVDVADILGFETTYKKEEVLHPISHAIEELATAITNEILSLNHHPPKAVMLVGGGSMTPELTNYIAKLLQLPDNRVAIRGINAIKGLHFSEHLHAGPELVTPIGIAIAAKENPIQYISIKVNEKTLRLFDVKQLTIGDGLLAAGIEVSKLYGKPGTALMVNVQDRLITIPGSHGEPPLLLKNNEPAKLDNSLSEGDHIIVKKGDDGKPASATVNDVIEALPTLTIKINLTTLQLQGKPCINGVAVNVDKQLKDRDEVTITLPRNISELFIELNRADELQLLKPFLVYVNNKQVTLTTKQMVLTKNGVPADLFTSIHDGDQILAKYETGDFSVKTLLAKENIRSKDVLTVFFNGDKITLEQDIVEIKRKNDVLTESSILQPNDELVLTEKKNQSMILQDLFRVVEVDLEPQKNRRLLIQRNGEDASFSSELAPGDEIEVRWVEQEFRV